MRKPVNPGNALPFYESLKEQPQNDHAATPLIVSRTGLMPWQVPVDRAPEDATWFLVTLDEVFTLSPALIKRHRVTGKDKTFYTYLGEDIGVSPTGEGYIKLVLRNGPTVNEYYSARVQFCDICEGERAALVYSAPDPDGTHDHALAADDTAGSLQSEVVEYAPPGGGWRPATDLEGSWGVTGTTYPIRVRRRITTDCGTYSTEYLLSGVYNLQPVREHNRPNTLDLYRIQWTEQGDTDYVLYSIRYDQYLYVRGQMSEPVLDDQPDDYLNGNAVRFNGRSVTKELLSLTCNELPDFVTATLGDLRYRTTKQITNIATGVTLPLDDYDASTQPAKDRRNIQASVTFSLATYLNRACYDALAVEEV